MQKLSTVNPTWCLTTLSSAEIVHRESHVVFNGVVTANPTWCLTALSSAEIVYRESHVVWLGIESGTPRSEAGD